MADGSSGAVVAELGLTSQDLGIQEKEVSIRGLDAYKTTPFDPDAFQRRTSELGIGNPESLINASSTTENLLGSGGNASVFSIPGIEGFVLRVPNGRFGANTSIAPLRPIEDRFPDINLGQAVASFGGSLLLKEQRGIPSGVPYGEMRRISREEGALAYHSVLGVAASMPQSSYDNLAELFAFLNENRLNFDPSKANNILIDREGQRFNVVDLANTSEGQQPRNNLTYMVVPLMDNSYAWKVENPQLEVQLTELRKMILLRCLEASKKAGLPLPDPDDSSLEYSFKLSGMEGQWPTYRKQLELDK